MFRRILIPLDGSSLSERALPIAAAVAQSTGGRLILVRAAVAHSLPGTDEGKAQLQAVHDAQAYLQTIARRYNDLLDLECVAPLAPPEEGILMEAEVRRADLIMMTTHGRSGLGRFVYGSVTESVLAHSPVPVWIVRMGSAAPGAPRDRGVRPRILVPLDGSGFAEAVLPYATALARALDWTVVLLRVAPPALPTVVEAEISASQLPAPLVAEPPSEADRYLAAVAASLKAQGVRAQPLVRVGPPAQAILDESAASGADLVVMATHGRSGMSRMLYGSVAAEVLHRGHLPLLLVRPDGVAARPDIRTAAR